MESWPLAPNLCPDYGFDNPDPSFIPKVFVTQDQLSSLAEAEILLGHLWGY